MQAYALKRYEVNSEVAAKRPEGGQTPGLLKVKNACRGAFPSKRRSIPLLGTDVIYCVHVENREVINRMTVIPRGR